MRWCEFFIFLLFFVGCAVVEKPNGGPADMTPPQIIQKSLPDSSTEVKPDAITFLYDEFIRLQNPEKQIILNPYSGKIQYKLSGKKLTILLPDTLKSNTTYSISFIQAVKDITEGNVLPFYQHVFSTGKHIDTCKIRVKVIDAQTEEPQKNTWIGLYDDLSDFEKTPPRYLFPVSHDGVGTLGFLPRKRWYVTALQDVNFNYIYDNKDEKIAFKSEPLSFQDTGKCFIETNLRMFKVEPEEQSLLKTQPYHFQSVLCLFRKPLSNPQIRMLKPSPAEVKTITIKDSLFFFVRNKDVDSLVAVIQDGLFTDTISVGLKLKIRGKNPLKDTILVVKPVLYDKKLRYSDTLTLKTKVPLSHIHREKIYYFIENDSILKECPPFLLDTTGRKSFLFFNPQPGKKITLVARKGAFEDIWGFVSDSTTVEFQWLTEEQLGSLTILFVGLDTSMHYVLFLKQQNTELVFPIVGDTFKIEKMIPGSYHMRLLIDKDRNGIWTNGSWPPPREPEIFIPYDGTVDIRGNWNLQLTWKVSSLR
ncbi:MAG: Ig-like domain-containing protein [Bacteroidales bacterium]|nr:Ig-like domain-containing protein [Bacteroidales bacterium]